MLLAFSSVATVFLEPSLIHVTTTTTDRATHHPTLPRLPVLIPALPGLEEYLSGMLIKAISEMTKVSEELFGGKKLEDFVHKTISAAFGGAKNLEMAGREVDKVKGIVEGAVNKMCEQVMVTAASAGKELMAARSDPGAKGAVCAIKKTIEEGKVGPVLRAAGHPMIEETLDWLHMKFLSPIEEELASKLMQVWSTVLDFVVGLGGLIPEVGGIIADAIVVPINLLSTTLINPLVANLQGGVWKSARAQILKITTPVLDAVIDVIEKTADAAKDAAADGKTAVTALVADSKKFVTENQGIIANLFVPVFEKLTAVAFPGVPAMVKKCLKSSDDVLAIAGAGDKFCDALTPAELANVKVCCKTSMVCCQAPGMKAKMFNKCREQNKPAAGKCGKAENKVKKKKQCKSKQHEVDMEKCTGKTLFGSLKKKAGEAKDFVVKKAGEASDKFDDMKDSVKNSAVGKGAQKLLDSSIEGMAAGKKKAKEMKEEYDKVKEETLNKVADVKDEAKAKIEEAKAKFGELKDGAKAKVSELKAGLNDLKDDLKDEAKERIEEAKKKLGELKDEATAKVSELKDGAKAKAKELKDGAKKAGEKLKGLFGKKL